MGVNGSQGATVARFLCSAEERGGKRRIRNNNKICYERGVWSDPDPPRTVQVISEALCSRSRNIPMQMRQALCGIVASVSSIANRAERQRLSCSLHVLIDESLVRSRWGAVARESFRHATRDEPSTSNRRNVDVPFSPSFHTFTSFTLRHSVSFQSLRVLPISLSSGYSTTSIRTRKVHIDLLNCPESSHRERKLNL